MHGSGDVHLARAAVGVLERGDDGLHISLDGPRPLLEVAEALEAAVEALDQRQPLRRLLDVAGRVCLARGGAEGRWRRRRRRRRGVFQRGQCSQ